MKYHTCPELSLGSKGHSQCVDDRRRKTKRHKIQSSEWDEVWENDDINGMTRSDVIREKEYERYLRYKQQEAREKKRQWKLEDQWDDALSDDENFGRMYGFES